MFASRSSILGRSNDSGAAGIAPVAWPPATGLRVHPGMTYTGSANDVQSVTFDNGLTMVAVGIGDPITIDADGLHFWMGKYLQYLPPASVSYSGMAAFARITGRAFPEDPLVNGNSNAWKAAQYPLGVEGGGARLFYYSFHNRTVSCDMGSVAFSTRDTEEIGLRDDPRTFTIGAYYTTNASEGEHGGMSALWVAGRIMEADTRSEMITPTEWFVGKDLYGTIHDAVLFTQRQGAADPLYPPGGSSQWVMDNIA